VEERQQYICTDELNRVKAFIESLPDTPKKVTALKDLQKVRETYFVLRHDFSLPRAG
jgi:recombinational DNA repair protein RecR